MKNLLYKEFKLSVHSTCYLFLPMAFMLLIPNYPYYVAFYYQTLGIFFIFLNGNTNNDISFTALLPVRKSDVVKARVQIVVFFELLQVIVAVPLMLLRGAINPAENMAGMEANTALIGLVLTMYGIFNIVFLPNFYKTAYKTGTPYLLACAALTLFVAAAEAAIQLIPTLKAALDTTSASYVPQQLLVLLAGTLLFALLTTLAQAISVKEFELLDL